MKILLNTRVISYIFSQKNINLNKKEILFAIKNILSIFFTLNLFYFGK